MNNFTFSGTISSLPHLTTTPSGKPACTFNVEHKYRTGADVKIQVFPVYVQGSQATRIHNSCSMGSKIQIEGYIRNTPYTTESGKKLTGNTVFVSKAYYDENDAPNKTSLIGRFTSKPELKFTSKNTPFCKFSLAIDRREKDAAGNKQADFVECIAWKGNAERISKFFEKGDAIALNGHLQVNSKLSKETEERIEVWQCVVDNFEFLPSNNKAIEKTVNTNVDVAADPAPVAEPKRSIPVAPSMPGTNYEPTTLREEVVQRQAAPVVEPIDLPLEISTDADLSPDEFF